MKMEISIRVNGKMICLMVMVLIIIISVPSLLAIGSMISNREKDMKSGLMEQYFKVNIEMVRNMVEEC